MDAIDSAEWESWPADVTLREVTSFAECAQAFTGLSEVELKGKLGVPGEETRGTRWKSASGELILQADRDLRYFELLPHVIVAFAIAGGIVARVHYMPKWRSCPPAFASTLGDAYAPK